MIYGGSTHPFATSCRSRSSRMIPSDHADPEEVTMTVFVRYMVPVLAEVDLESGAWLGCRWMTEAVGDAGDVCCRRAGPFTGRT